MATTTISPKRDQINAFMKNTRNSMAVDAPTPILEGGLPGLQNQTLTNSKRSPMNNNEPRSYSIGGTNNLILPSKLNPIKGAIKN